MPRRRSDAHRQARRGGHAALLFSQQHPASRLINPATLVSPAQGGICRLRCTRHDRRSSLTGPRTNGFLDTVPDAEVLWCLSTGCRTWALFVYIEHTPAPWEKFKRVVLVHAVRVGAELVYRDEIALIAARYAERFQYDCLCLARGARASGRASDYSIVCQNCAARAGLPWVVWM